jgi:hypothetical protein
MNPIPLEYCYKLNIQIDVDDMLSTPLDTIITTHHTGGFINLLDHPPINKHYRNICDMQFDQMFIFQKPVDTVHVDSPMYSHPWGINWICGGTRLIEFWDKSTLSTPLLWYTSSTASAQPSEVIKIEIAVPTWKPTTSPIKSYTLLDGGVYLINASTPHRVVGYNSRAAVSIRSKQHLNTPWIQIVNEFSELILPW